MTGNFYIWGKPINFDIQGAKKTPIRTNRKTTTSTENC